MRNLYGWPLDNEGNLKPRTDDDDGDYRTLFLATWRERGYSREEVEGLWRDYLAAQAEAKEE